MNVQVNPPLDPLAVVFITFTKRNRLGANICILYRSFIYRPELCWCVCVCGGGGGSYKRCVWPFFKKKKQWIFDLHCNCPDVESVKNIRICHEYEGGIEKFVPMITVWHHQAYRVMTNGDPEE